MTITTIVYCYQIIAIKGLKDPDIRVSVRLFVASIKVRT